MKLPKRRAYLPANQVVATLLQGKTIQQAVYGALLHDKKYPELQKMIEAELQGSLVSIKGM